MKVINLKHRDIVQTIQIVRNYKLLHVKFDHPWN